MTNAIHNYFLQLTQEAELADIAEQSLRGWPAELIVLARAVGKALPADVITWRAGFSSSLVKADFIDVNRMKSMNADYLALAGFLFKRQDNEDYLDGYARLESLLQQSKATATKLLK